MIETVEVSERIRKPLWKKLNPMWWFGNEGEQTVDEAPWYMPHRPRIVRYIFWNFFRNPMMNFRNYVIGVGDRTYTVVGKVPAMCIQRDDLDPPELGWQWSFIRSRWLLLPFVSYCGRKFVMQLGWQPFGYAEIKLNWRKAGGYNPGVSECDRAAVNRGS
jgi:hypothetical protein